jgi:phosphatidate phosphatase APP1
MMKRGRWRRAAIRGLRLLARPVRRAQGEDGLVLEPYRGYGSHAEIFLIGRAFRQSRPNGAGAEGSLRVLLRDVRRRITRRPIRGARITARFGGSELQVTADRDGYFRIHLRPRSIPPGDGGWHAVDLVLAADPPVRATGQVFIPPARCRCVIISDIDDTVMRTGVANKLKMLWRLFVADAASRVAFPGAAALYRALHAGAAGNESNPMLYVSRAPWGIYDMLTAFFRRHAIPEGPVMFLREWGLSWRHPLPRRAEEHKRDLIVHMLRLYADLPFVLIGDSGQHDPEVYAEIVAAHPGRVVAVYIRNVSYDAARIAEIERLAASVTAARSSLVLAADSVAMAEHAAGLGLIAPEAVAAVAAERRTADTPEPAAETRRIDASTAEPAAGDRLRDALDGVSDGPPNLVVEAQPRDRTNGAEAAGPPG